MYCNLWINHVLVIIAQDASSFRGTKISSMWKLVVKGTHSVILTNGTEFNIYVLPKVWTKDEHSKSYVVAL